MNFFSNSTSRLIIPRWRRPDSQAIQQDTLATTCKYASTEGRFSIIDKRHKESSGIDSSDSSSEDEFDLKCKKTVFFGTRYDHRITFPSPATTRKSSEPELKKGKQMNGSRFRIVPVESCYERGRWACCDFYNAEPAKQQRERRTSPLPLFSRSSNALSAKSFRKTFNSSLLSPTNNMPHTAPPSDQHSVTFSFDFGDKSDTDNRLATKALCDRNNPQQISPNRSLEVPLKNDTNNSKSNKMVTDLALAGRMTPVEMLNSFGLERSLTATYSDNRSILEILPGTAPSIGNERAIKPICCGKIVRFLSWMMAERARRSSLMPDMRYPEAAKSSDCRFLGSIRNKRRNSSPVGGTVVAASGAGTNTSIIAIDGKIEQAMDLVKTHLMFAVREEVDVLRAKIVELEATILQLEAENAILREHVPVEILNKLSLQTIQPNSSTTAAAV